MSFLSLLLFYSTFILSNLNVTGRSPSVQHVIAGFSLYFRFENLIIALLGITFL